jgi:phosphinothricin acetyltransferase
VDILTRAAVPADLERITEIYNQSVLATTATFDTRPRTPAEQRAWFGMHGGPHPVLEAEGCVVGWASLSAYSDRAAYDRTVEISVYVADDFRRRGAGRLLMERIIGEARRIGHHTILARITTDNTVSIRLHESLGFTHVGTLREVGTKFGKLLDVEILQLLL